MILSRNWLRPIALLRLASLLFWDAGASWRGNSSLVAASTAVLAAFTVGWRAAPRARPAGRACNFAVIYYTFTSAACNFANIYYTFTGRGHASVVNNSKVACRGGQSIGNSSKVDVDPPRAALPRLTPATSCDPLRPAPPTRDPPHRPTRAPPRPPHSYRQKPRG